VHGCEYRVNANDKLKRTSMRIHFRLRHIEDTIVIDQEGQLPQCRLCGFFGSRTDSDGHRESLVCQKFAERRRQYFQAQKQARAKEITFQVGGQQGEPVSVFG
jgi:hypothetical protein